MKQSKLIMMAALAVCFGAPAGFRTANAAAADVQTAAPAPAEADNSTLGLLCKGADVDPGDVRWRVAAGLDVKQAVDAAIAQKESAALVAKAAAKKGGK